jgi:hypothetical protein
MHNGALRKETERAVAESYGMMDVEERLLVGDHPITYRPRASALIAVMSCSSEGKILRLDTTTLIRIKPST